jgi:predicted acylesterase/phospholipase RssA
MIGRRRLRNFRTAIETIIAERIPGDILEAGVWRGGASIYARGVLKAYGDNGRKVYVADSFDGLPKPDQRYPADQGDQHWEIDFLKVSLEAVKANFKDQWDMLYIADQSFNTMQNAIARKRMADNPPDHLIGVPRNKFGTLEFDRSAEMIEHGYQLAEKQLSGKI